MKLNKIDQGLMVRNLVFASSRSLKTRELSFEESVVFFNFLMIEFTMFFLFFFDIIVSFIVQKLKNKHTSLK